MPPSEKQIESFRAEVWGRYRGSARDFPWRRTRDPYAIMASEFMLQQTQTARVVEKYEAWMRRFPTVQSVAQAELSEVLALWNGLGYNRRAKFLHEACKAICAECGGVVPNDAERLDALPGIGAYTARAICAFAFGQAQAFIETNIRSAFIHFFFAGKKGAVSDSEILPLVELSLDRNNPREWYYALMDYGAELKKRGENPSRKSKGYSRQSAFKGSLRQARGAILRQLSQADAETKRFCGTENSADAGASDFDERFAADGACMARGLSLEEIAEREHIDMECLSKAAEGLAKEKMIRREGGRYVLG